MELASLFQDKPLFEQRALTIFRAALIAREEANWKDLFTGFDSLRVITYSSGLELILQLAGMFEEVEVTFGSERILSHEHATLEQASSVTRGYTFVMRWPTRRRFSNAWPWSWENPRVHYCPR